MDNLSQLPVGRWAKVTGLEATDRVTQRLVTLGLLPGMRVRVVQVAPLGDPIAVEFSGQRWSLRCSEASGVSIQTL